MAFPEPGDVVRTNGKTYVFYEDEVRMIDGITAHGTLAWVNKNPGNITHFGGEAERYGAYPGKKNGIFAIFPTEDVGFQAIVSFLKRRRDKTITGIMEIYAPRGHGNNDPDAYARAVAARIGVPVATLVGSLTDAQLVTFAQEIKRVEGTVPGQTYPRTALPPDLTAYLVAHPDGRAPAPTQANGYPLLRLNDTGPLVTTLELLLQEAGYADVAGTGTFDATVDRAVRDFQTRKGLQVDGIVGKNTWSALCPTRRLNDTGFAVRAIQDRLSYWDIDAALENGGVFDAPLDVLVRAFQTASGLGVDGIVGPNTWRALLNY